jgi:hypothetical protein
MKQRGDREVAGLPAGPGAADRKPQKYSGHPSQQGRVFDHMPSSMTRGLTRSTQMLCYL